METIYQINTEINDLLSTINFDQETGELVDDPMLKSNIDALLLKKEKKILSIAKYTKIEKKLLECILEDNKRLHTKIKTIKNKINFLENLILENMENETSFEDVEIKISKRKNSQVKIIDEDKIPNEYCKITRSPNKNLIKKWLKEDGDQEAATLIENFTISLK